jgi:hypothetical protein
MIKSLSKEREEKNEAIIEKLSMDNIELKNQ